MMQPNILITGATGNVGSLLADKLALLNIPFSALVRSRDNCERLSKLPQAKILIGDLADKDSLKKALQGIEKAFLLTNSSEQAEQLQFNFVDVAYNAGVKYIVKLSQFAADINSPVRFLRYHAKVENRIKDLGMAYTFLRPNLYMQGLLAFKESIKNEGKFYASIGKARVSIVDVRDIASVAAFALTEGNHENKIYNITGPQSLTHYQMADIFSKVLNKEIEFIDVTSSQMRNFLQTARFPEWQIEGLIEDYAHYARGEATEVYNTVEDLTGKNAMGFEQFVNDYKSVFKNH